jgi:phage virion morphogenesis protein
MNNIELDSPLKRLFSKLRNPQPLYRIIAGRMHYAVEENFRTEGKRIVGGWQPLSAGTLRWKRKKGAARQILQFKGQLVRSIQEEANNDHAAVGSNLRYGRIHQEGGTINIAARSEIFKRNRYSRGVKKGKFKKGTTPGKGFTRKKHSIRIPARPFLKMNQKDLEAINNDIKRYLITG